MDLNVVLHITTFLMLGTVVGGLLMPGKQPGGWRVTTLLGIAGSMLGGFIAFAMYREGGPVGFLMSLVGAIVVVAASQGLKRRRVSA